MDKGIVSGQYNYDSETGRISRYHSIRWYEALFAVAVAAGVALSACLGVMHRYSMKPSRRQKENGLMAYRAGANFCMNNIQDILVKQFTTHTRISTSSGGREMCIRDRWTSVWRNTAGMRWNRICPRATR